MVGISFIAGISIGQQLPVRNIYLENLPSPATFIIETDGNENYWATNSSGKIVVGPSTNATYVLQWCIDNLGPQGDKILIRKGKYDITLLNKNHIHLQSNMALVGEDKYNTILVISNPRVSDNWIPITLGSTLTKENITIRDLTITSAGFNTVGIYIWNKNNVTIDNVRLINNSAIVRFVELEVYRSRNVKITNTEIKDGFFSAAYSHNILFEGNRIAHSYGGYTIYVGASSTVIIKENVLDLNKYNDDIYLRDASHVVIANNIVKELYTSSDYIKLSRIIRIRNGSYIVVESNVFGKCLIPSSLSGESLVRINWSNKTILKGNIFDCYRADPSVSSHKLIYILDSNNTLIEGNYMRALTYGVYIDGKSSNTVITSNTIILPYNDGSTDTLYGVLVNIPSTFAYGYVVITGNVIANADYSYYDPYNHVLSPANNYEVSLP